ncbi:MAG: DUF4130 domain-containing protein [Candidatus Thorarchaeota archaeon]
MFRIIKKKEVLTSLARYKDITPDFLNQIKEMPKEILENVGTERAKKAVAMSQKVNSDLHSHKAFLRLSVSPHGILYGKSDKMEHHNEKPLVQFFHDRFPTFIILFESKRGVFSIDQDNNVYATKKPLESVLQKLENKLPVNPLLRCLDAGNYQKLWESFAQSQIIKGRGSSNQLKRLSKNWKRTVAEDKTIRKQLDDYFYS